MSADRSTLWLLDLTTNELWTKIPFEDGSTRELRMTVVKAMWGRSQKLPKP